MTIDNYIAKSNFSKIITPEIRDKIIIKNYKSQECIFDAHSKVENIYLIIKGKVEVSYIISNGKPLYLNLLKENEIFGDIEYLGNKEAIFDVISLEESIIVLIPFDVIEKFLSKNYSFWKFLCIETNNKMLKTNKEIISNKAFNLKTYFSNYLIQTNYNIKFNSLDELAIKLNVSYRNLSRIIKKFVELKIIEKNRNEIIVLDKIELHKYIETI